MNRIILIILALGVFSLTGCDDDKELTEIEQRLLDLRNDEVPWVLANGGVEKDGYDVSDQFTGFKLSIGDYTYRTQNSLSSAWPSSGSWEYYNDQVNLIRRDDGVLIQVSLSGSRLVLSFDTSANAGGRLSDVPGNYTFNLESE